MSNDENGYKKPPRKFQFTKGKSGNPKGRPKGSKDLSTAIAKAMSQTLVHKNAEGEIENLSMYDVLAKQLVKTVAKDPRQIRMLIPLLPETKEAQKQESAPTYTDVNEEAADRIAQIFSVAKHRKLLADHEKAGIETAQAEYNEAKAMYGGKRLVLMEGVWKPAPELEESEG